MAFWDIVLIAVLAVIFIIIVDHIRVEYQYRKWVKGLGDGNESDF